MHETQMTKWSWSALMCYRTCKRWALYKYVHRYPEPPSDPNKEQPNERGSRLHLSAENFVRDGTELAPEFAPFTGPINDIKALYDSQPGAVTLELREYYDHNWVPTTKENQWLVVVKDVKVATDDLSLTIDYKTGKKFGNEVKHYGQCELYAVTDMITHDNHEFYDAELWYIDQKDVMAIQIRADKLLRAQKKIDDEVQQMMEDKLFRPTPSKVTCKYCPYSPKGTGRCPVGVTS